MTIRAAMAARVDWAFEQLLQGRATSVIVSELAERYGVSQRSARRDVGKGYSRLVEDLEKIDRTAMVAKLVCSLETALAKSLASNQPAVVVACARTLADLLQLQPQATAGRGPYGSYGRSRNG